jgi:putative hydrolase of the HAD superfamily
VASATLGCIVLAAGLFGYLLRECSAWQRGALIATALLLIKPGWATDLAGLALLALVLGTQWLQRSRELNAWAQMERGEIDMQRFAELFEAEARAFGGELSGHTVIGLLSGQVRPEMVEALKRVRQHHRIACITNNMPAGHGPSMTRSAETAAQVAQIMQLFEHVVESSKLNMRKPDPRIYRHACELLGVAPEACVYLDDLGINLKPARAMGMATIKVESAAQALGELEALLGMALR